MTIIDTDKKNSKNTTSITFLSSKIEVAVIMTEVEPSNSVTLKYSSRIIIITIFEILFLIYNKNNIIYLYFIITYFIINFLF